jgi:Uncharacterized conserved protein
MRTAVAKIELSLLGLALSIVLAFPLACEEKGGGAMSTSSSGAYGATIFTVNESVRFRMIAVEGGAFTMGSKASDAKSDQKPAHEVRLDDFLIGETEVTQALWQAVMGSNPSGFRGESLPVDSVTWDACQAFVARLGKLLHEEGQLASDMAFRLPTEAQWEYAARGGQKARGYAYAGSDDIDAVAWTRDNAGDRTHPVAGKAPNELGLYDMSGNVWEWVQDYYGPYEAAAQANPTGPARDTGRVIKRGGSWYYAPEYFFRPGFRYGYYTAISDYSIGLRLCLVSIKAKQQ